MKVLIIIELFSHQVKNRRVHTKFTELVSEAIQAKKVENAKQDGMKQAKAEAEAEAKTKETTTFFGRMLG